MNESNRGAATIPPAPPPTIEDKKTWAEWVTGVGGPLIGLVLLCVIFSLTSDVFLTWRNALNVIDQITVLGILAIGMTAVIIIGGIDLSVGSILAFSMMMMGWLYQSVGVPLGLAIVAGLLVGTACGLVNGLLITRAKLPPFIATLTMMSVARGLANIITEGRQIVGFPDWFTNLSTVRHFRISLGNGRYIHRAGDYQLGHSALHDNRPQPVCHWGKPGSGPSCRNPRPKTGHVGVRPVGTIGGIGVDRTRLPPQFFAAERRPWLRARYNRRGSNRRCKLERRRRRNPRDRCRRSNYRRSTEWIEPERRFTLRSTNRNWCRHRIGGGRRHASQARLSMPRCAED